MPMPAVRCVQVTLIATNGTLNLSGTQGLTFTPPADGTDDASMTFTGTVADINAALEGMTFVATPGYTGTAGLQITTDDLGNSGAGGHLSDTDTIDITIQISYQSLWLSTAADVASPSGAPGLDSWTSGEVLQFGNPNLAFEPGTTDGTFSSVFNLDTFAGNTGVVIDAIHYVGRDIEVGAVTPMQLYAGDVILSTVGNYTYTSTNSLAVNGEDAFVFRPDTPGDYSSGTFILLIDKSGGLSGKMSGITLIEQDTVVGDVTLNAGDFLYIGDNNKTVERWQPDAMGAATSGTETLFIDGADIDIGQNITAIDVIETDTTIGDVTLTSGQVLLSLMADDSAVGDAPTIGTLEEDIFILDLTTTGSNTAGTATRLFEGLDVGLNSANEDVWAFSLVPNEPPVINDQNLPNLDENSPDATVVGTVTGSDPEGNTLSYAITAGNTDGAFAINATTGEITVANSTALDFETTPTFNLTVAVIDDNGAYETATVTVNLNDIDEANDAPSFDSGDGIVTTGIGAGFDTGTSVAMQADGKILVAGYSFDGANYDFALVRYNSDGSLDTSFSTDGKLTTSIGTGSAYGQSVAVQTDGKILVGGYAAGAAGDEYALARYNSDGSLDTSFSGDGIVTTSFGLGDAYGESLTLQADGKILVSGYYFSGAANLLSLARYNADGSLDTSFSGDGLLTTSFGGVDNYGFDVAVQSDGAIVVVGSSSAGGTPDFAVARYDSSGNLDTTFSGDGLLTTPIGAGLDQAYSVSVQDDGKLLVAGYSLNGTNNDFALVRYNSNGTLDTSFGGGDGIVTTARGCR